MTVIEYLKNYAKKSLTNCICMSNKLRFYVLDSFLSISFLISYISDMFTMLFPKNMIK